MSKANSRWSMMLTRAVAVAITFGVGAASFTLSFTSLRDLATRGHVPSGEAWLWPVMVDGAILLATLGVVVMAGDPQCRKDRRFFWAVLGGGAVVSIACNAMHAVLPADQPLNEWLRGFLAGVAPVALLVTTHGLTLLTRLHRRTSIATTDAAGQDGSASVDTTADDGGGSDSAADDGQSASSRREQDAPVEIPADTRWHAMAPQVFERARLQETPGRDRRRDVAEVMYLSYETTMTNRQIGKRLEMSHHTVGKIQTAGAQVLQEEDQHMRAAS
jgi:hypothetical protein